MMILITSVTHYNGHIEDNYHFSISSVGIVGEAVTGWEAGHFKYLGNGHHITMYSFFALNAVVDVVYHYR